MQNVPGCMGCNPAPGPWILHKQKGGINYLGVRVRQGPHRPAPILKKNDMINIELTEEQAQEVLKALTSHILQLNGYIFNSRNEKSREEFERKRRMIETLADQIQNRLWC